MAPVGFTPTYTFAGLTASDTGGSIANTGSAYNNVNVGVASTLTVSGLSLSGITGGGLVGDYNFTTASATVAANITPATLSVIANAQTKTTVKLQARKCHRLRWHFLFKD